MFLQRHATGKKNVRAGQGCDERLVTAAVYLAAMILVGLWFKARNTSTETLT